MSLRLQSKISAPSHEAERLRQFLKLNIIAAASGGIWMIAMFAVVKNPVLLIIGIEALISVFAYLWALRIANRNIDLAVTIIVMSLWVVGVTVAALSPTTIPVSVLIIIMSVIIALPYISSQTLMRLIIASTIMSALLGVLYMLDPPLSLESMPQWTLDASVIIFLPVMNALTFVLLWQYNSRLAETMKTVEDRSEELSTANIELALARDQALESSRIKSEFLAKMSHEFRTPLNAIIGYSEMLQEELEEQEPGESIRDLQNIAGAGNNLLKMVNDVLDFSRIEAGTPDLVLEEFSVRDLTDSVISEIRSLAEKNLNTLEVKCPADIVAMRADVSKVRRSLFNLLSNACKFTQNGRVAIVISQRTEGGVDWVDFQVTDTGIGMSEAEIARLFQVFVQGDVEIGIKYGGVGLGLPISQSYCRLMGGDITVASKPGKGSTFVMTLPAIVNASPHGPKKPVESDSAVSRPNPV